MTCFPVHSLTGWKEKKVVESVINNSSVDIILIYRAMYLENTCCMPTATLFLANINYNNTQRLTIKNKTLTNALSVVHSTLVAGIMLLEPIYEVHVHLCNVYA